MTTRYIVRGLTESGNQVFYTGRAGDGWITTSTTQAFSYRTIEEARRKALIFNRNSELHGLHFIAIIDPLTIWSD